jgi:hypothetical protein
MARLSLVITISLLQHRSRLRGPSDGSCRASRDNTLVRIKAAPQAASRI